MTARPRPDSRGRCAGPRCGMPVQWVVTEGGRRLALDPAPDPGGNVVLDRTPRGEVRARVLGGSQMPAEGEAWRPHWQTCVDAVQFKARRHRRAPRCVICGQSMDEQLARREGWIKHPSCDATPPDRARAGPAPAPHRPTGSQLF